MGKWGWEGIYLSYFHVCEVDGDEEGADSKWFAIGNKNGGSEDGLDRLRLFYVVAYLFLYDTARKQ